MTTEWVLAIISLPAVVTFSALLWFNTAASVLARLTAFWTARPVVSLQLKALLTVTSMGRLQAMPVTADKVDADLLAASSF